MRNFKSIIVKIITICIFTLLLFSLCSCEDAPRNTEKPTTTDADNINTDPEAPNTDSLNTTTKYTTLLWEGFDATLWATNEEAKEGGKNAYLMLKTEEDSIEFMTTYSHYITSATKYINTDVTGDNVNDHILIFPSPIASNKHGIYEREIHVFDGESNKEIPLEDSFEYLTPDIQLSSDEENFYLSFNEKTLSFKKSLYRSFGKDSFLETPVFDNNYKKYRVEETEKNTSRIYVDHPIYIESNAYEEIGTLNVVFSYCENEFACESFSFSPSEDYYLYTPELLDGLKNADSLIPEISKAATAFITKDTTNLEKLLGCRDGVLEKYADFEFGKYTFEVGKRQLLMTVEITKSSLPDVPPGEYTVTFSEGRWGVVSISGLGSYSYEDESNLLSSAPGKYIRQWINFVGPWDFSSVKEISQLKDSSLKCFFVMYLKNYNEDIDTIDDYQKTAKDIFGIQELDIPDTLIEEDGTVVNSYGHGGFVRTFKKIEERTDSNSNITTIYIQTYADFAGTVRSHIYEYKFKDCGEYYKVIYSGILKKGEYEPENRYIG